MRWDLVVVKNQVLSRVSLMFARAKGTVDRVFWPSTGRFSDWEENGSHTYEESRWEADLLREHLDEGRPLFEDNVLAKCGESTCMCSKITDQV